MEANDEKELRGIMPVVAAESEYDPVAEVLAQQRELARILWQIAQDGNEERAERLRNPSRRARLSRWICSTFWCSQCASTTAHFARRFRELWRELPPDDKGRLFRTIGWSILIGYTLGYLLAKAVG